LVNRALLMVTGSDKLTNARKITTASVIAKFFKRIGLPNGKGKILTLQATTYGTPSKREIS